MARFEDWQSSDRNTVGDGLAAMQLSQSAQALFKIDTNCDSLPQLPHILDFGTAADLYSQSSYSDYGYLTQSRGDQQFNTLSAPKPADSVASNPGDKILAIKNDELNHSNELAENVPKKVPHDGSKPPLKEFFSDYKSPVMEAYDHSKSLKDGQDGKSKTLEGVIDRLKACPWLDMLSVHYDSKAANPEYSNLLSRITLRPQDEARQTENFAHEGFHATHQFLSKLYDHGKVSPKEFENIFMQGEVDSMLTEVRVHHDLNPNGEPPKFYFYGADNKTVQSINIQEYADQHGKRGLVDFLRTAKPVGENLKPYSEYYLGFYQLYLKHFDENKPLVDKFIKQWVDSGHKRDEI